MTRKILHLDLDAFYCAVEEQRDPRLRGRAFAVGGRPDQRGVVASCSYAARLRGVHSAMPMARALKLCPGLIIVSGRHSVYGQVSHQVMERLWSLTEKVEQVSIDEAFLDVTDLSDPGEVIAQKLQAKIRDELGLPCSLGVATNKLVAKIANDVGKSGAKKGGPPNAITVVPPGKEAEFLAPLPVRALWGVGPKTEVRLLEMGITSIGELAAWPGEELAQIFGKNGRDLAKRATGIDDSPIVTSHTAKSFSQETTFARDVRDAQALQKTLSELSEGVVRQLNEAGMCCHTIKIKLRWSDFTTITRQLTLESPTDRHPVIHQAAQALFEKAWPPGRPVRLLGVGASGLSNTTATSKIYHQLQLWDEDPHENQVLQDTIARLQQRFGASSVQRGSDLDNDSPKQEEMS